MPIALTPLPYAKDALAPAISAATLELHHGKHHKGYVDKTNAAIEGTDLTDAGLNDIVKAAAEKDDAKLFNQAAQAWNHGFYWHSLSPESGKPGADLAAAIEKSFGSHDDMLEKLSAEAEGHFASGWAWLLADGESLSVATTHDAGCPLTDAKGRPLLVIDVWEHAYYLDRKNDRKAYLTAALGILNWAFADANFASKHPWTYPG
ncbi:Fe-Mn family superoxide dismutase [Novosphingobium kunmingense]|uniref:Superoxide dismutase n=1 Tax=Novosphingobium kunmingense TaxID=1211806 RepID=A0A2N0HK91_9SPHN|nr:superoxide dismutase [Novosphingobium kunmingense]PKB19374.1 Fe-Mn family superoxide dismutase [Novosphingobium kunmingense]